MRWIALALLPALAACGRPDPERLHLLFDRFYEDYLQVNPEDATSLGRTEGNDRWRDWSREAREAWASRLEGYLAELGEFESSDLGSEDRISAELLRRQLDEELQRLPYDAYLLRVNQLFGLHTAVFQTVREMPARTEDDFADQLARLRAVPSYVDQSIAALEEGVREGIVQNRRVVDLIVGQLAVQSAPEPADSPLLAAFREMPATIAEPRRQELLEEAERAYREAFQPAWRKLGAFLAERYAPRAREDVAVTALPGGEAIYAFFIELHTTLPLAAREIHDIGLGEVDRIEREMETIVREAGFDGTVAEYEYHLRTDPKYLFSSKPEMLAYHRDLAARVAPELTKFFHKLPRHPFGIRAIPPDREAASASNYNAPSVDGTRPGWFNLKAYMPHKESRFDKPALVLHETNPGHHLQIATQLELEGLPAFRKIYRSTAYIEGWALYAESLGGELGVYGEPWSRFGALESERFRARRLVVDTGLHVMGWTRRKAIEYLGDESEVDRYIAWPGQALAYKLGQLKISELKRSACEAYGTAFDIRDFHDAVLRSGPLPLGMLKERVGAYVARADPAGSGPCSTCSGC